MLFRSLRSRLLRAGFSEMVSENVVNRCIRSELISDQRFSSLLIKSKKSLGWGKSRISYALKKAGIDPDKIDGFNCLFDEDEETRRAIELLQGHHSSSKDPYHALYGYLVRKGFSSAVASRAVRNHLGN